MTRRITICRNLKLHPATLALCQEPRKNPQSSPSQPKHFTSSSAQPPAKNSRTHEVHGSTQCTLSSQPNTPIQAALKPLSTLARRARAPRSRKYQASYSHTFSSILSLSFFLSNAGSKRRWSWLVFTVGGGSCGGVKYPRGEITPLPSLNSIKTEQTGQIPGLGTGT